MVKKIRLLLFLFLIRVLRKSPKILELCFPLYLETVGSLSPFTFVLSPLVSPDHFQILEIKILEPFKTKLKSPLGSPTAKTKKISPRESREESSFFRNLGEPEIQEWFSPPEGLQKLSGNESIFSISIMEISPHIIGKIVPSKNFFQDSEPINFSSDLAKENLSQKGFVSGEKENFLPDSLETGFPKGLLEICPHGLPKRTCAYCKAKEERKTFLLSEGVPGSFDFFDLALPALLPTLDLEKKTRGIIESIIAKLYPFQRAGINFLFMNEFALLADEMGLGKSIQALISIFALFQRAKIRSCLILCPKSVLTDWKEKARIWAPFLKVLKVHGLKEKRISLWKLPAHIHLSTYETLREDFPDLQAMESPSFFRPKGNHFDLIIFDEMQKIKNPSADSTRAAFFLEAFRRWGLTGTPLENSTRDFIILSYILGRDYIKPYTDDPFELREKMKPFILRRKKEDVLKDLPPKRNDIIWLELTPLQKEYYEKVEKEGIIEIRNLYEDGIITTLQRIDHIFGLITKLKQICNFDPQEFSSSKAEYLIEKLQDIVDSGEKALIFSQYPEKTLRILEGKLQQFSPLLYTGQLSEKERDKIIEEFQNQNRNKVLLISVKSGGLGISLTRANHVFHFDLWWNPSIARQAEDRAHRIGQKRTVFVKTLLTKDTIEERIHQLLESKKELFKIFIDDLSDRNLSNFLSEEDLLSLFGFSPKIKNGKQSKFRAQA